MLLVEESLKIKKRFFLENADAVAGAVHAVVQTIRRHNKIMIFGNGGSAADAQHIAAEFVNRYLLKRPGLPALALTTDTSILTSVTNDEAFKEVFARQIEALGNNGDLAWGITTSGDSANVVEGLRTARKMGMTTLVLTGRDGGKAANIADHVLTVAATSTPRIQETHMTAAHIICELVERELFSSGGGG
jgi:D-sedoheptulose 7-phosphate isomerase